MNLTFMNSINFRLVLRTLYRNRLYTILNVLGLSIGMASAILIFCWVRFQVSYDRFHENGQDIYRIIQDQYYTDGQVFHVQATSTGISRLLKENIPQVSYATRYNIEEVLLQVGENKAMEKIQLVDPDFLRMFSFPLIKGTADKVLKDLHSMVISQKMAQKYFGNKNPIGEIITLESKYPFTITGILHDNPKNTEFQCEFLIPFKFYKECGVNIDDLNNNWISTYVQLNSETDPVIVNKTIEDYKKKNFPKTETVYYLQPLKKIHLYWIWGGGPIKNVRLFSIVAALIILIAAINFTNLSTAMASNRFKEIGLKKSFGASAPVLMNQFLSETLLLSAISMIFAMILAESFMPWFNSLLQTELNLNYADWHFLISIALIMLVTGILSGFYPAVYLSSFKPAVCVLKAPVKTTKRSLLREGLVVLQFTLALVLIINTIIIKKQRQFLQDKEVGIQKENIIYMPVRGDLKTRYELFKSQLLKNPEIQAVSFASHLPTGIWSNGGSYKWQGKPAEVDPLVSQVSVDFDFVKIFGIKMVDGSFYSEGRYKDTMQVVINKAFSDIIDLNPIVGQILDRGTPMKIIGVTENFNFKPLTLSVEPLVMYCNTPSTNFVFCKVNSAHLHQTLQKMEDIHNEINGNFPFEFHFLNDEYENLYKGEIRQGKVFNIFALLAILISCLGLFGLSSYMMTQRIKEIGIRKANGASVNNIMFLFTRYYIIWIGVAYVIAVPVSCFFAKQWLKDYAYHTVISTWIFLLAGALAILIAFLTVAWQSRKAARMNPVDALRYE